MRAVETWPALVPVLLVLTGCTHHQSVIDTYPKRVVALLAASEPVCGALQVALDSLSAGHHGAYVVLAPMTTPYNTTYFVPNYLHALIGTPLLLADTWRSFQEQNQRSQPTCDHGTRPGSIVHAPFPSSGRNWVRQFATMHPDAIAMVNMSGPGVKDDVGQLFVMLDVSYADGEHQVYHALLDRSGPGRSWRIRLMINEHSVE